MKIQLTKFLLLVGAFAFTIEAGASDRWETLRAINWVENPTNQTQAGRYGELGPYQFRPATWRMHTSKPFNLATQRAVADEIAVKHYEWIKRSLEQAGVAANSFNIAMAWNCGLDAVLSGRAPSVSFNYAKRVNNLVESFKDRQRSVIVPEAPPVERNPEPRMDERGDALRFRILQDTPRFVIAAG
jgi:hypothetical protein